MLTNIKSSAYKTSANLLQDATLPVNVTPSASSIKKVKKVIFARLCSLPELIRKALTQMR